MKAFPISTAAGFLTLCMGASEFPAQTPADGARAADCDSHLRYHAHRVGWQGYMGLRRQTDRYGMTTLHALVFVGTDGQFHDHAAHDQFPADLANESDQMRARPGREHDATCSASLEFMYTRWLNT